jgi:hypothetical protein
MTPTASFVGDGATDFPDGFSDDLRRNDGGILDAITAALAEVAGPIVVGLRQFCREIELAHQPDGQRVAWIGDRVADLFDVEIFAVIVRIRRLSPGRAVEKNIPAERWKIGTTARSIALR